MRSYLHLNNLHKHLLRHFDALHSTTFNILAAKIEEKKSDTEMNSLERKEEKKLHTNR